MTGLFVDTSAWSLMFRRDRPERRPVARRLEDAIAREEDLASTGLVLQELLQGFVRQETADVIIERFTAVDLVNPSRDDHVHAADIRNRCRRAGVQVSTVDAVLTALCIDRGLTMLSNDRDFTHIARHVPLECWQPPV